MEMNRRGAEDTEEYLCFVLTLHAENANVKTKLGVQKKEGEEKWLIKI